MSPVTDPRRMRGTPAVPMLRRGSVTQKLPDGLPYVRSGRVASDPS